MSSINRPYSIPSRKSIYEATEADVNAVKVVSLFAGGGGSSTGYRMAGARVVLASEFVQAARETYAANYPSTILVPDDIREVSAADLLSKIGMQKGDLDVLDGSPPCSAFSTAGKGSQLWGKEKAYSDIRQSSVENLFFEYIRILQGMMPKTFIAENVQGLVKGRGKGFFNEILRGLRLSGYHVEARLLDAKWLGVPQSRPRLIFVGIRSDLFREDMRGNLHPKPKKTFVTTRQAFEGLSFTDEDDLETNEDGYMCKARYVGMYPGEQHSERFSLFKLSPESISPALLATSSKGASDVKHWDNRWLTLSERKRLMSVPDDFILAGSSAQNAERIGRMVAPFMAKETMLSLMATGVFEDGDS